MGILGNEAADVVAKKAAEGVRSLEDNEKWMSGGGIQHWARQRKKEYLDGDGEGAVISRVMKWKRRAVTNSCRLRGDKGIGRWWDKKVGRVKDAVCPRCREEDETLGHIVFRCQMIKRVKEVEGRDRIVLYLLPVLNSKSYDGRRDRRKWATEKVIR